jgi:hypothetical protein
MQTMFDEMCSLSGNKGKRKIDAHRTSQNVKVWNHTTEELWTARRELQKLAHCEDADACSIMAALQKIDLELESRTSRKPPMTVALKNLVDIGFCGSVNDLVGQLNCRKITI